MSKHEVHKTAHINSLSEILGSKDLNKTNNYANMRQAKKDAMMAQTIQQNEYIKKLKSDSLERSAV
jgi:hypothetical protein